MARAVLLACLPWFAVLIASVGLLIFIGRTNRARFDWRRMGRLHADQYGGVQSLSFVLTLPLFVMVMLFIVQVSQLMIATIVVHYAAFAAARSATVWIPARLDPSVGYVADADMYFDESENCISMFFIDPEAPQDVPVLDPDAAGYGPMSGGMKFIVEPGSPKYEKIRSAAVLACMAISPSRELLTDQPTDSLFDLGEMAAALSETYRTMAPASAGNAQIDTRIWNKLAYANQNTTLELRFYHKNEEPPLVPHPGYELEFRSNEIGWQDQLIVTVNHDLALLPGPGRLLSRFAPNKQGEDRTRDSIAVRGNVYVYPLTATCIIGNEGEKSVVPYAYQP